MVRGGREALARLLPARGKPNHALYYLGQAITSTALAEGITAEGLVRRLLESDLAAVAVVREAACEVADDLDGGV